MRIALLGWFVVLGCGAKSALEVEPTEARDATSDASTDTSSDAPFDASIDVSLFDVRPDTAFDAGDDPARPPRRCRERPQPVDVLLVLDSSGSMLHDIPAIAVEVPELLRNLVQPPDLDGDGRADWAAVEDFHFAVALTADDGEFNRRGDRERPRCLPGIEPYEPWQRYQRGDDLDSVLEAASCTTAHTGLGREDLISVALQSLLPPTSSYPYRQSEELYAEQSGFLRDDSVLVILFLTDEDDDSECTGLPTDMCIERCREFRGERTCEPSLATMPALIEGFAELRAREVVMAGVLGVAEDETDPTRALGCMLADREAEPAPRMAELISFYEGGLYSICQRDYRRIARDIAARVGVLACDE